MADFWLEVADITQSAMDGLLYGSTYALIGIGFTLIFGVMRKVNIAFGAASLAGTYASLVAFQVLHAPAIVVFAVSVIASGVLGYVVYLTCFRFIAASNELGSLLATIGMLLFLDEVTVVSTQGMPMPYPVLFSDTMLFFGPFSLRSDLLLVFVASVVCTGILLAVIYRTRLGLATRVVSQQPVAALLCGISVPRTNATTFVLSGFLGGVAGSFIASSVGLLSPLLLIPVTLKGLVVTVIGGLGSIPGAIVAGLLVGLLENVFLYFRGVTERDIYVMLLLFIFLAVRPRGLLGRLHA
ncbi:MAG: branched-chain amino acid ABC transporter permease [Candidatus Lambdaproteobacteria bacterium]|nr:branched-chain amino acid ABC transporter permease [Candidatus Lambdaproteobacteria bacterium]